MEEILSHLMSRYGLSVMGTPCPGTGKVPSALQARRSARRVFCGEKATWDTAASSRGCVMEGIRVGRSAATDLLGVKALPAGQRSGPTRGTLARIEGDSRPRAGPSALGGGIRRCRFVARFSLAEGFA